MATFNDPEFYGDSWAEVYDQTTGHLDTDGAVEFLSNLAKDGRVLELGIGTGRIALPLAARGVKIAGIDASAAMVQKLREKPGGQDIPVTVGDMAEITIADGPYRLAFLIYNTLFSLPSQARQMKCFENVAAALEPDGLFVVECFVPDLTSIARGQRVSVVNVTEGSVTIEFSRYDVSAQRIRGQLVTLSGEGIRFGPIPIRYAWPDELDLMAARVGLTLRHRFRDWAENPYRSGCERHVSVYESHRRES
jgi:SAM-dependent methyltransferase